MKLNHTCNKGTLLQIWYSCILVMKYLITRMQSFIEIHVQVIYMYLVKILAMKYLIASMLTTFLVNFLVNNLHCSWRWSSCAEVQSCCRWFLEDQVLHLCPYEELFAMKTSKSNVQCCSHPQMNYSNVSLNVHFEQLIPSSGSQIV